MGQPPSTSDGSRCSRPRSACQVTPPEARARLSPHGAAQDRLHPHRRRSLLRRGARGGHAGRGARLRLGVDGRASLRGESLLALAPGGARRLRHANVAAHARYRHPRGGVSQSGAPRRGRGAARRHVRRALYDGDRHRLQTRRVRPLRGPAGEARGAVRGAARDHQGALDPGTGQLQRRVLHGRRTPRAQARREAPPAHLDRGLGGHHPQARRDARRQLDPGSDGGPQAPARRQEALPRESAESRPERADH